MALPNISFKEFAKNPIVALLFMSLIALTTLYIDNRNNLTNQIDTLNSKVNTLEKDYKKLNEEFRQTLKDLNKKI